MVPSLTIRTEIIRVLSKDNQWDLLVLVLFETIKSKNSTKELQYIVEMYQIF